MSCYWTVYCCSHGFSCCSTNRIQQIGQSSRNQVWYHISLLIHSIHIICIIYVMLYIYVYWIYPLSLSHRNVYKRDNSWGQGLISAAQEVAASVQHLVNIADGTVKGEAAEESLIVAANAVSSSTARLVTASTVKNVNSATQVSISISISISISTYLFISDINYSLLFY